MTIAQSPLIRIASASETPDGRRFWAYEHLRHFPTTEWAYLYDEWSQQLGGIRGKEGVTAQGSLGHPIGIDLLELQPGSGFPLHIHPGDHILYVLEGPGKVHIDGVDYRVIDGDSIFIPAEYPHGVQTFVDAPRPFRLLAFGHPHKPLSATDRMHIVDEEIQQAHQKKDPTA